MPRTKAPQSGHVLQLKVTLRNIRPPIWRRLLVPSNMPLSELHGVIQVAMGWLDGHLHMFITGQGVSQGMFSRPEFEIDLECRDERQYTVDQMLPHAGMKMIYEYDFGDGWEHEVLLEKILPRDSTVTYPLCVKGKRACPPEDCGGPWGYAELLEALADPGHERHEELSEWLGRDHDPEALDIDEVNAAFRRGDHLHTSLMIDALEPQAEVVPIHPGEEDEWESVPSFEGPVWIGGSLQHSHITIQGENHPYSPVITFWIESHPRDAQILAMLASDPNESAEDPIVAGLRMARANAKEFARPEPASLVVLTEGDRQELLGSGECQDVSITVDPRCTAVLAELLEEFHRHERAQKPLNLVAPVPGNPGVTAALARDLFRALASFQTARPWTGLNNVDAFRITLPGQAPRIVSLMGGGGAEYGAVLFDSVDAIRTMSEQFPPKILPDGSMPNLPSMLGFSFDWKEECHPHLAEHLEPLGPQWLSQERHPVVTRFNAPDGFVPCTSEDFETLTAVATVFARLARARKKERAWPPEPGFVADIPITRRRNAPTAHVEFLGSVIES